MQLGEMSASDPAQEPFFQQQPLRRLRLLLACARQGFEQPGLTLAVAHPVQQRLAAVRQQLFGKPAIDHLAFAQWAG